MRSTQAVLEIRGIDEGKYIFDLKIPHNTGLKSFTGYVDISLYIDSLQKFWSLIIDKEKIKGIKDIEPVKDTIHDLGGSLWNCVGSDARLKKGFETLFDYVKQRKGVVDFILRYDTRGKYDVPWELMLAPDRKLSWCEVCMMCRVPKNSLPSVYIKKEKYETVNVLIVIASSKGLIKFLEGKSEFKQVYIEKCQELNKICENIGREKRGKVEIENLKSENFHRGNLRDYIQNLKKQYDLLIIIGESIIEKGDENGKFGALNVPLKGDKEGSLLKDELIPIKGPSVYFLDTCCSARNYKGGYDSFKLGTYQFIEETLNINGEGKSEAVIFIGQLFQVEMLIALIYVKNFLQTLFLEDSSISGAVWGARKKTRKELENINLPKNDKELLKSIGEYLTRTYTAYGRSENVLCSAPAFRKRKTPEILWLPVSEEYYRSISERLVQPLGVRDYEIKPMTLDWNAIKNEIERYEDPVIAEIPIIRFADIKDEKEKYVIIGCGFFPKKDDCGLFINRESSSDLFKEKCPLQVYHSGEKLSVTSFFNIFLEIYEKLAKNEVFPIQNHLAGYERVAEDLKGYIKGISQIKKESDKIPPPTAWILAGGYFFLMKEAVKKFPEVKAISIRKISCELVRKYYNLSKFILPATIIITKLRHLRDDPKLYYDIFTKFRERNKEIVDHNQIFNIHNIFKNDMETPKIKILDIHDIKEIPFLSQETTTSIIYSTKFLKDKNILSVEGNELIDREIDIDDFFPVMDLPEGWRGKDISEIKEVMLKEADNLVKIGALIYAHKGEGFLKMFPKLKYREKEIKNAETKFELNAIKFKLDYEKDEIIKFKSSLGIDTDIEGVKKNAIVWIDLLGFKKFPAKLALKIKDKKKLNISEQSILQRIKSEKPEISLETKILETEIRSTMGKAVYDTIRVVDKVMKKRYVTAVCHIDYRAEEGVGGNDEWILLFGDIWDALIFFYELIKQLKIPFEAACDLIDFGKEFPETTGEFANRPEVAGEGGFIDDNIFTPFKEDYKKKHKDERITQTYILVSDEVRNILGNRITDSIPYKSLKKRKQFYLQKKGKLDEIASFLRKQI